MSLTKAIENAVSLAKKRNWDKIYVAIDLHDTIIPSSYETKNNLNLYEHAGKTLKKLSVSNKIVLILFTSSYAKNLLNVYQLFGQHGIKFDYINENPEVASTDNGNFVDKFYYNLLLDDKAGFDPLTDWEEVYDAFYGTGSFSNGSWS